ncbi:DUF1565 [Desulfonema limicola]|uniref:DUF1565 n=1 Tax=Desulfonema limicola TaxID=45656 RepID=A0A975GFB2_9BACT|nr:DUF1565 domain-containing protein [Desulfonema limicola]QTA79106.1 DUF1565 [Desulfonema limicola]
MKIFKNIFSKILITVFFILCSASVCAGTGIYVSPYGSDTGQGNIEAPFKTIAKALTLAEAGDIVYVRKGTYNEKITFPKPGTNEKPITLKAYEKESVIIQQTGQAMYIDKPYIIVEDIIFDGNWGLFDVVKLKSEADFCILRGLEIRNSMRDTLDLSSPEGVIIENCLIHDAVWFENGVRKDAHGIVTEGVKNLTIRNTEIFYVSGDTLQFQYNGWNDILVENCKLWNAPLPSARGGAPAGVYPGENAIDTKYYTADGRGRLYVKNTTAYGWHSDYIDNAAAFNIKHNVEAEFDGITVYDSEIAFRLRGSASSSTGGAWVTLKNAVIYNSDKAVRYEDDIENLHIYNLTFGKDIGSMFQSAGGYGSGFEVKNCLFFSVSKPAEASYISNITADSAAFINSAANDYHLSENAAAIDTGIVLTEVSGDRDSVSRPQGIAYDIGAYEYVQLSLTLDHVISILKLLAGMESSINNLELDMIKNNKIDIGDAVYILQKIAKIK